jgi:alkylation response protein AidB-like acyl-CoA dehydrogenase
MLWRVAGLIEAATQTGQTELKAVEEYAAECSMIKVFCSEALSYVVDEGVQIHGGYGFHQHYDVERTYRDSRINRLFEGTNEINRLVAAGMPLKRAARGLNDLLTAEPTPDGTPAGNAKAVFLFALQAAHRKHGADLEKQQELIMNLADIMIETLAMESAALRAEKISSPTAKAMAAVFSHDALARIESCARHILASCAPDLWPALREMSGLPPVDTIALRRQIADRLLSKESYAV